MGKLYDKDLWYSVLRPVVDQLVRTSFREITVSGESNIPSDGAVIFAPNHCNTLMDALVVLQVHSEPLVFGARADIFKKKLAAKALRFLRIVPVVRMRDSLRQVARNREIMEEVVEAMEKGLKFCIFCEGTHRPKHSLLPVRKGIIRTALLADERFGDKKNIYIVPVGLEYKDYFRFRTSVKISYGPAINVTSEAAAFQDRNDAELYRSLTTKLSDGISSLITYLPDDETYEGRWILTKIAGKEAAMGADEQTLHEAVEFDKQRKNEMISIHSFGHKKMASRTLGKALIWLVMLPAYLFCALASLPMWLVSLWLCRNKIKDKAFRNTARFGVKFAMIPIMIVVWALVIFIFLPWYIALPMYVLALFSHSTFYEITEYSRRLFSDIRYLFGHKSLKLRYEKLRDRIASPDTY